MGWPHLSPVKPEQHSRRSPERELGPLPTFSGLWSIGGTAAGHRPRQRLAGFPIIALLLLAMGVRSIVVIGRMNQQVERLITLEMQRQVMADKAEHGGRLL